MQRRDLTGTDAVDAKAALFLQTIRTSTANLHTLLESNALLSALLSPQVTVGQYCCYLTLMHRITLEYENVVLPHIAAINQGYNQGRMSQLIEEDLESINYELPHNDVIKDYTLTLGKKPDAFWLGFMYVMEGSKLGGKVIYKHIHRTLGFSEDCGAKYIADYGSNTFGLWKRFLSDFSGYIAVKGGGEEAIEGANFAFSSIYKHFENNRVVYEV